MASIAFVGCRDDLGAALPPDLPTRSIAVGDRSGRRRGRRLPRASRAAAPAIRSAARRRDPSSQSGQRTVSAEEGTSCAPNDDRVRDRASVSPVRGPARAGRVAWGCRSASTPPRPVPPLSAQLQPSNLSPVASSIFSISTFSVGRPDWSDGSPSSPIYLDHVEPIRDPPEDCVVGSKPLGIRCGDDEELASRTCRPARSRLSPSRRGPCRTSCPAAVHRRWIPRARPYRCLADLRPGSRSPARSGGRSARRRSPF